MAHSFEILPDESIHEVSFNQGTLNIETNIPISLFNIGFIPSSTDPETAAREYLKSQVALFHFDDPELADLKLKSIYKADAGTTVRFQQFFYGVKVYKGEISVNISPANVVSFIMNNYQPGININELSPAITEATSKSIAYNHINQKGDLNYEKSELIVYVNQSISRLVWQFLIEPQDPLGYFEILVDANNGNIIKAADLTAYCKNTGGNPTTTSSLPIPWAMPLPATGNGNIFNADPLSSAAVAYAGAYVDASDATNASLDAELSNVSLLNITFASGNYSLIGPYAEIQDFENPNRGLFAQASSTFNFNRNNNGFEAVNTYYFIDMSMRYINLTLGCSIMPFQYASGVRFDPHGLNGADNSHYLGGSGRMSFGEGGVDDAEDSDVILHELGHGIHDWVTGGSLSQVQGLSEGSGDYWAQSHSRSLGQWTTADAAYHWVFNWDGHNPFWGGRTTNYGAAYPGGLVGAIHTDGQIWSTCLMKIWDAIGKTKTDKAFLEGLALTNSTSSQQVAANAVQQAAINMGYSSADLSVINTLLSSCGYAMSPLPLAAEVVSFDAVRKDQNQVSLDWKSVVEENGTEYFIERKLDHEADYKLVGKSNGISGGRQSQDYEWLDDNNHAGTSYYRLRMRDGNGDENYSEVQAVLGWNNGGAEMIIYPNPSNEVVKILLNHPGLKSQDATVTILDLQGKVLISKSVNLIGDKTKISIPEVNHLNSGVYVVRLKGNSIELNKRLVIGE